MNKFLKTLKYNSIKYNILTIERIDWLVQVPSNYVFT